MNKEYIDKHEAYLLLKHKAETYMLPATKEAYEKAAILIGSIKVCDVQPVKQDTELSIILQDYGIKDTDTLRYILDQYQKIIVDITGGQMSYLTYPAETVIACADDNYRKCYEESMKHGRWVNLTPMGQRAKQRMTWHGCVAWMCSECHGGTRFISEDLPYELCPHCGAIMTFGGGEEEQCAHAEYMEQTAKELASEDGDSDDKP
jgi:hypothetical protein